MSEKKELTYILGAGASYESMPVVKTFADRFEEFQAYFSNKCNRDDHRYDNKENYKVYTEANNQITFFRDFLRSNYSFDLVFKKMFHLGKDDAIKMGKKVLHLYFLWEHLQYPAPKKPERIDDMPIFWKQSTKDKRYDALIAGLLQPIKSKSEMHCKTNFITWNYDFNLLESIKYYFYPQESFKDFFKEISTANPNLFNIKNQISVLNMNGYFYSEIFDDELEIELKPNDKFYNWEEKLLSLLKNNYFSQNISISDSEKIQFAWEMDFENLNQANSMMKNSKNIVVIGYTFPLYNRLVDLQYLNREA